MFIVRSRCVVAATSSIHIHDGGRESAGIRQGLGVPCATVPAQRVNLRPAEDPRVEAARCDTFRAIKTSGVTVQEEDDFDDDADDELIPEQGVVVRTAWDVLAALKGSSPPGVFTCSANSLQGRRALEATAVLEFPFTQAGQNSVEELGARLAYVHESSSQTQCSRPRKRCSR
jgi:hypothetical protein